MTKQEHVPEDDSSNADGVPGDFTPNAIVPGDPHTDDATADAVARLTGSHLSLNERRRALVQIAAGLRRRGFKDMFRPRAAMNWIADTVVDVAPRVPVRNLETLRQHFPGLADEEIADRIVRNASRTSGGIGAVGGGVSAIQWAAPPTLLSAPVLLAAETVAVVAVELKMIGELQELYGQPVQGGQSQRAVTLLQAWAARRGVNLLVPGRSMAAVIGTTARHELSARLVRRFGRNLTALGPLLTGAAVAAFLNRRGTMKLADEVRKDLAKQASAREITAG